MADLTNKRFILLGEKHDNVDHHNLQAHILQNLGRVGILPVVGFEQLNMSQESQLKVFLNNGQWNYRELGAAVGWEKSGWPKWEIYSVIAKVSQQFKLPIVATNFDRKTSKALYKKGLSVLGQKQLQRLKLNQPLSKKVAAQMGQEIMLAHCHQIPKTILPSMVMIQRARDAMMALNLYAAAGDRSAVLITGSMHARLDRGVPSYLKILNSDVTIGTVAFVEVLPGQKKPSDYAEQFTSTFLPFDYIWFTPAVDDEDPCEKYKKDIKKIKSRPGDTNQS